MQYLPLSFIAGILTVLAPCVLPLLPVIIGGSLTSRSIMRPVVITLSLALSVILFTLLLQVSSQALGIPYWFWKYFSGVLVILFGLTFLFPSVWKKFSGSLNNSTQGALAQAGKRDGLSGMVLTGMALGPVFTSCSPTYGIILGTVLPQSFTIGLINLIAYALGLAFVMFLVAFLGQRIMGTLRVAANPDGWFKKAIGVLFIIVGVGLMTGYDKKFEAYLVSHGWGMGALAVEDCLIAQHIDGEECD